MELNKPNDIFVASTLTPDINVFDLEKSNILPDNTSFYDKETYKNTDFAKKTFVDDHGNFDETKFNKAYENASSIYSEMSNDQFLKNNLEWDAYDFMRSPGSKTRVDYGEISKDINPYKNLYGRTSLHSVTPGNLTVRELAQQSKVFDYNKGEFTDKSANDLGLFGTLFNDTLVYAQWDEDGISPDPITGRLIKHRKGDYKLNDEGNFYTETLGNREIYGKQIVNPTDVITSDESYFNKFDYFDSDGKDKSVTGTVFKIATQIAPLFIPGVAVPYGTFKMAVGLSSVLPTFYKSLEGILLGDSTKGNETEAWKAASKLEGFMAKYANESFSDKGSESMWNFEQLSQMVASTFSQVYEQRAAANLSKYFYKTNDSAYLAKLTGKAETELQKAVLTGAIENEKVGEAVGKAAYRKLTGLTEKSLKQSGLAKSLSLGYMALTSTADIYSEALAGGYDRRTAGFAALLAAGGQYGIMMNNRMADWFLDDAVGFNVEKNRASMRKVLKENMGLIDENINKFKVNKLGGKKGLALTIGKIKQSINNIIVEPISSSLTEKMYKNSLIEGVEEVTEQMVLDATKGIVDTMSWLGLTKNQGSFNTIQNVFSSAGLENYLSNFVGGLLGGGIFELNRLKIEPMITGNAVDDETNYSLIRMVANGQASELKAEIDSMTKAMGNDQLDPLGTDENGKKIYVGTDKMSQAKLIGEATKSYIDYLDKLVGSEGLKMDDETVIKKAIINEIIAQDLEKTGIDKFILSDFNILTKEIIDTKSELDNLKETEGDKKSELTAKLKNSRDKINELISGQKAGYYKNLSLWIMNKNLHSPFLSLDVYDYTKKTYNKDYNSLPKDSGTLTQDMIDKEFKNIMENDDNKKDKFKFMYSVFQDLVERHGSAIADYSLEKNVKTRDKWLNVLTNSDLLSKEALIGNQAAIRAAGIAKYDLSERLNIPLGDLLIDNNYLNIESLSPEEIEQQRNELNSIGLSYNQINSSLLSSLFYGNKKAKIDALNKQVAEEATKTGENVDDVMARYAENFNEIERLTPKMKNPESKEELPLDVIYLTHELANDEDISHEVATRIKKKTQEELNKKKELLDLVDSSKNNFEWYDEGEDDYIMYEGADEAVQKINDLKAKLKAANTLEEFQTISNELNNFLKSFEGTPIQYNIESVRTTIPTISDSFVNAEKLLQKNIIDSKLYDLLNTINVDIFNKSGHVKVNVLELLKGEINALNGLESIEDYVRSTDTLEALKRAISAIKLAKAISSAMLKIDDDVVNIYGFTNNLRDTQKVGEKTSESAPVQTLDYETYTLLNKDLNILESKLNYLIDLSESNKSTVAAEQENIKNINSKLLLDALTNSNGKYSLSKLSYKGQKLIDDNELAAIVAKYDNDEERILNIAEVLNKNFITLYNQHGQEVLTEIFSTFNNDDFKKEVDSYNDPGLTRASTVFHSLDYFIALHTMLSFNYKEFYSDYKKLLEKEVSLQTDQKAPFYAQEFSIRNILAYRKNKLVMSHVGTFLQELTGEKRIFLKNGIICTGSGGVGKTTVISNFSVRMESDPSTEILVTAPGESQVDKLKKDISRGEDLNITSIKKPEVLRKVLGSNYDRLMDAITNLENQANKLENNTVIKDNEGNNVIEILELKGYEIRLHPDFVKTLSYDLSRDNDTVLYIDEVSWFNPLELEALDYVSGLENSRFSWIGLGDELQRGNSLGEKSFSLDAINYIHPPKLKGVIRADNDLKKDNISSLESNLKVKQTNLVHTALGLTPIDDSNDTNISFSEKGFLKGDKIISTLNVQDLLKLDPTKEIAVITDKGILTVEQEEKFKEANLMDKIKIISKDNIQGKEFSQVVSLFDIKYTPGDLTSLYNAYKYLYTLLSRGKTSTLMVGNGGLATALGIVNVQKEFSADVALQENKVSELLNTRLETISNMVKDYSPTEEVKEEVSEIVKAADTYINSEEHVENVPQVNKQEEQAKVSKPDHDGDNKYLMYSFYNALNAKIDADKLDISDVFEEGKLFDLQILRHAISETTLSKYSPEEIIDQFVIAKNHILHGLTVPAGNLFVKALSNFNDSTGTFVVRKIVMDEYNQPYQKQAHKLDANGNERMPVNGKTYYFLAMKASVFSTTGGDKIDGYVTLAALPDINNEQWTQKNNKSNLESIYKLVDDNAEVAVNVNKKALTGINIVYEDGTSNAPSKENNGIHINGETPAEFEENLTKLFPGLIVSNLSQIEVFDDNEEAIKNAFKQVGYKLDSSGEVKNTKVLRFRPYIKVSYIDPSNDEVSKILVLNPRNRSLVQAKAEYEAVKSKFRATAKTGASVQDIINKEFPALISKYQGWKLLFDVLNYFESGDPNKIGDTGLCKRSNDLLGNIINIELDASEKEEGIDVFNILSNIINEVLPSIRNSKGQFDLSLISKESKGVLLGKSDALNKLLGKPADQTRLGNVGLRVLDSLSYEDFEEFSSNWNRTGEHYKPIYYNAIWKSKHSEEAGVTMSGDFIKYLELNCFVEPPIFLTELTVKNVLNPVSTPEPPTTSEESTAKEVTGELTDIFQAQTMLNPIKKRINVGDKMVDTDGIIHVNFASWKAGGYNEEQVNKAVAIVYSALQSLKPFRPKSGEQFVFLDQISDMNNEIAEAILGNPSFINKTNNNVNMSVVNTAFTSLKNKYGDLLDFLFDEGYSTEDFILSSKSVINLNTTDTQNKELNSTICK